MIHKILIVGAGEIGSALAQVLQKHKPVLWDHKPKLCTHGSDLRELAQNAQIVFLCIPSHAIDECSVNLKEGLSKKTILVSLTKGLERKTGQLTSELLSEHFGRGRIALLGGPMLAEELRQNLPTQATLASTRKTYDSVAPIFKDTIISLEHTTDVQGVSAAGVLKNVYALSLGMAQGLKLGDNAKGVLIHQAVKEMGIVISKLGGRSKTALSLAGIADLEATANSNYSHNKTAGMQLATSGKAKIMSEGALSLPLLTKRLGKDLPPLLNTIKQVVLHRKDPNRAFRSLIN